MKSLTYSFYVCFSNVMLDDGLWALVGIHFQIFLFILPFTLGLYSQRLYIVCQIPLRQYSILPQQCLVPNFRLPGLTTSGQAKLSPMLLTSKFGSSLVARSITFGDGGMQYWWYVLRPLQYTLPRNELLCQKNLGHRYQQISHKMNIRLPGQLKNLKSWGPFWSYQLNSTANLANLDQF